MTTPTGKPTGVAALVEALERIKAGEPWTVASRLAREAIAAFAEGPGLEADEELVRLAKQAIKGNVVTADPKFGDGLREAIAVRVLAVATDHLRAQAKAVRG
jgi:hypothetical protein